MPKAAPMTLNLGGGSSTDMMQMFGMLQMLGMQQQQQQQMPTYEPAAHPPDIDVT